MMMTMWRRSINCCGAWRLIGIVIMMKSFDNQNWSQTSAKGGVALLPTYTLLGHHQSTHQRAVPDLWRIMIQINIMNYQIKFDKNNHFIKKN